MSQQSVILTDGTNDVVVKTGAPSAADAGIVVRSIDIYSGSTGSAVPTSAAFIAGTDGANLRGLLTNSSGTLFTLVNDLTTSGTLGALNANVPLATAGAARAGMQLAAGTLVGTIVPEISFDGGTTWVQTQFDDPTTGNKASSIVFGSANTATARTIVGAGGMSHARVRVSAYTSGTANINIRGSTVSDPTVLFAGQPGSSSQPTTVASIGGWDGTNLRAIKTDASGNTLIAGLGTAGTPSGGVVSIQGVASGTVVPISGTITANIGTSGSLALDATLAKLTIAQSAALGANTQAMVGGSVTTAAPSYTTGNINPLSLTTAGALRVDGSAVTQPVSGTITANIGTTNGLALDTSVNGILLSQGSTTSGQKGSLIQGAVTTTAPTYTTAQTSPLSLTTAGALRVDGSGVTQPISGTVTANAGSGTFTISGTVNQGSTPTSLANAWPVKVTDGTNTLPTMDVAARKGFFAVTDGTNTATVKAASTAAVATDTALVVAISPNNPVSIGALADSTTIATALGALNATVQLALAGYNGVGFQLAAGTLVGTIVPEVSLDGGTTWVASFFDDPATGNKVSAIAVSSNAVTRTIVGAGGSSHARVRVSAYTSGTSNGTLRASQANDPSVIFTGALNSNAQPQVIAQVGGWDGANLRAFASDASGNQKIIGTGTAGTAATGVVTVQGIASGTNLNVNLAASAATVTVSGTVTSNIGTTNGLALDATLAKLTIAQSTALGSNTQAMVGGSVTTAAPTYTTGNINPLSLTTAGALRVDGSGVTQPVSGTITANAGTGTFIVGGAAANGAALSGNPVRVAGSDGTTTRDLRTDGGGLLFAKITDGTNTPAVKASSTVPVAADNALVVSISPNSLQDSTTTSTALGALNAAVTLVLAGYASVGFQLAAGTLVGTIVPELSTDGGTTWVGTFFDDPTTGNKLASIVISSNAVTRTLVGVGGASHARVRVSAYTSGTSNGTVRASQVKDPSVLFGGAVGSSGQPPIVAQVGGWDGANLRAIGMDSSNRQIIAGAGVAGTPAAGVLSVQGVASGTNLNVNLAASAATVTVTGTVTSNIGTTNGLALDTTVAKMTIAQSTALGANTQTMVGGSVTTTAPTYTTGNINPLSLTTAGALRVDGSAVTQPVSGTVTANIGTSGSLALDTSVNGLLVAQASTTSGQKGPLIQGAVTTGAPTYTTAQTSPLSLTTAGALRVDATGTTQPVSGTITSNQGTANTVANGWPVKVTDGTNTMPTMDVAARKGFYAITDGTNTATVKAASTAAVATDTALVVAISPNNPISVGGVADTVTGSSALGALNATVQVTVAGQNGSAMQLSAGTLIGTIIPELSFDGATTWVQGFWQDPTTGQITTSQVYGSSNTAAARAFVIFPGVSHTRVRVSAYTSGTANATVRATAATVPIDLNESPTGVAVPPTSQQVGGSDGTLLRTFATDTSGNQKIIGTGTAGTAATGVVTVQGIASGTNLNVNLAASAATVTVSGTVTSNIGTTNGLALDATLAKLTVAQSTALGSNTQAMVGGSVTTAAPSYTTGNINPLSLTTAGALRVDGSAVTQPVSGTTTANQGTANSVANGWPVKVTDGTNTMPTMDVAARKGFLAVTDGTNTATVKAASTAAVATDTALVVAISPNNPISVGGVADTATGSTALGSLNAAIQVALAGLQGAGFQLAAGTLVGTIVPEVSYDGGTTWWGTFFDDPVTGNKVTSIVFGSSNTLTARTVVGAGGASHARVRVSAFTSGTANAVMRASQVNDPSVLFGGAAAAAPPPVIAQVGGSDGAALRALKTDTNGRQVITQQSGTGALSSVAATTTPSTTILASSSTRLGATVYNESASATLYVAMNATCTTSSYTTQVPPGGYYETPFGYTGIITGVWSAAVGNARVTQISN